MYSILALECSNMFVSGFTFNFVLQNQFLHRKFYTKSQKMKNAFLDPKKTFSYKTCEKTLFYSKSLPYKVSSEDRKNVQGKNFGGPNS